MATGGQKRKRSERVAALELPPGTWGRAWIGLRRRHALLRIALSLLTAMLLCAVLRGWDPPFTYRAGYARSHDIVARVPFEMIDAAATERDRDRARRQVRYVYTHNPEPLTRLPAELRDRVARVLEAQQYSEQLWAEFQPLPKKTAAPTEPEPQRFEKFRQSLAGDRGLAGFEKSIAAALQPFKQNGLLERRQQKGNQDEILIYPAGQPEARKVVQVSEVLIGDGAPLYNSLLKQLKSPDVATPICDWRRPRN
jgi:hypothetical protein